MLDDYGNLLTINEVIRILHKSKTIVYCLIRNKSIKAYRSGYKWIIPKSELLCYIRNIYIQKLDNCK